MNTKHTPGPWHVLADPQWENHHPLHKCRFIANKPEWDYVAPSGHGDEWDYGFEDSTGSIICKLTDASEQRANAHLIAAAPELLEALRKLLRHSDKLGGGASVSADISQARAAIARATGE